MVLSPATYNDKSSLVVVCPITNSDKNYPFHVKIRVGEKITGVVLSDQVRGLDWRRRNATFITEADEDLLNDVIEKVAALIV